MTGVTILVAMVAGSLAFALKPTRALCVFVIALLAYSQNLTVPLGSLDFTVSRIVILALMANLLFKSRLYRIFRWRWADTLVLLSFLAALIAYMKNVEPMMVLERQGGWFLDAILPYYAARLTIRTRSDLIAMVKVLALVGIPLALMGIVQSVTGSNPVGFMESHYGFGLAEAESYGVRTRRFGLWRADVTIGNAIIFGLFFAGAAPLAMGLMGQRIWRKWKILIVTGLLLVGVVSSVSSAPLFATVSAFAMIAAFRLRRHWRVMLVLVIAGILFVEVFSNRHFYHVLTRLAFNKETAYYRIGLVEEAMGGGMQDHWLVGYGYVGVGPGNDNTDFNWYHQDLVNIYIRKLAQTGLLGLLPFLLINILFYRELVRAARRTRNKADQWLIWCLGAALLGQNVAFLTVSAMGQVEVLLYMLIGICFNMNAIVQADAGARASARWRRSRPRLAASWETIYG